MKPSWSSAPHWANFLAMDEDGKWAWFEREPKQYNGSVSGCGMWNDLTGGRVQVMGWRDTMEGRPYV